MEFTGERYVPGVTGLGKIYVEHMSRYVYAAAVGYGARILDLGCGCGYGSHFLALQGAVRVIGIDKDPEAIDFARRNYNHPVLSFEVMDATDPKLDSSFDLITCFELIEHLDAPEKMLECARSMLEGDGLFLASTPNKETYKAGGEGGRNPFHFREYDSSEFYDLLKPFFPEIVILGQRWAEAIILEPTKDLENEQLVASLLPERYGAQVTSDCRPDYFLAICGLEPIPRSIVSTIRSVVVDPFSRRYWDLKQAESELREEFDKRGRWAKRLDQEIREKDKTIARLMQEVEALTSECEIKDEVICKLEARLRDLEHLVRTDDSRLEGLIRT